MRLLSPVFAKEMLSLARRKRYYFTRFAVLAALLTVVGLAMQLIHQRLQWQGYVDTARWGSMLLGTFTVTQLIAAAVLMPALTAPLIAAEKDRKTLGLVMMTNLRPHHILLDKMLSRMVLIALLLLSGLPLFISLLAFGGVTADQIGLAYTCIIGTILACSAVGLWCSTLCFKTHTALITAYLIILGYVAFVFFMTIFDIVDDDLIPAMLPLAMFDEEWSSAIIFSSGALVLFLGAVLFCIEALPRQVGRSHRPGIKRLFTRLNRFFRSINFTRIEVNVESRSPGRHPLLWKETQKRFFASTPFLVRSIYVMIILSLILFSVTRDWDDVGGIMSILGSIALGMLAVVSSATAFTSERERGSLEVLLTTPLRDADIVVAKFVGVLRSLVPLLLCVFFWGAVSVIVEQTQAHYYRHRADFSQIWHAGVAAAAYLPMVVVIGLYASAKHHRIATSLLVAFLICLAWVLSPLGLFVLDEVLEWANIETSVLKALASLSPISGFALLMSSDFIPGACAMLIPCWVFLLFVLCERFDVLVGRQ